MDTVECKFAMYRYPSGQTILVLLLTGGYWQVFGTSEEWPSNTTVSIIATSNL